MSSHQHVVTVAGTVTGTLFTLFATIQSGDMVKAGVLSGLGAIISFIVSLGLKWIAKRVTRKSER